MRPRESFFLVRERFFSAKDLANDFNMRFPREINIGFAKDSRKYGFLFAKNGRLQIKDLEKKRNK